MFDIHPDLRSVKAHPLPTSRLGLCAIRGLLSVANWLRRRRYRAILTRVAVRGSGGHLIPTLVIRPDGLRSAAPALVYYHGGAFVMKAAPQHLENAIRYAREAACVVVFVEYRLAPSHVFPAGFDDCHEVLLWTLSNAEALGVDETRITVGGDSAGGGLAAGVAQRALHEDGISLRAQLLIYPVIDLLCTRPSMSAFADVPPFRRFSTSSVARVYLGHAASAPMPAYASPICGDVDGVPATYIETPEFDPLHDQGVAYAHALTERHVIVELNEIQGGLHGFDILAPKTGVSDEAMKRRIEFLRRTFAS
jgi:acetyl esterase/lipase